MRTSASSAASPSVPRDWTPEELAIIRTIPKNHTNPGKLTPEQVIDIRRRVDSLSVPWTLRDIARDYDISIREVVHIARRKRWGDRAFEPDNAEWWWSVERRERAQERERRKQQER